MAVSQQESMRPVARTSRIESTRLVSFDGTEAATGAVERPERHRDVREILGSGPAIARGGGLSYAAASMGEGVTSIDLTRFDRILNFDPTSGAVRVEAGVTIGALAEFLIPRGYYPPVTPGYPAITVGGCVVFDVHGKNQVHTGNFSEWVDEVLLLHPDHGDLRLSRNAEPELFALTPRRHFHSRLRQRIGV